jgi:hypothetical protein
MISTLSIKKIRKNMTPTKPFAIAVVAALLTVGGLAACGSSDDSTSTTAALTSDELVSQTNAICKDHADAINSAVTELFQAGQPSAADVRTIVKETILPQYSAQIGQLDALTPPADLAGGWDRWITDSTTTRDAIKDDPNAAFDQSLAEFKTVNDEATALGLGKDCLVGPT